jgi:hypothetical protein
LTTTESSTERPTPAPVELPPGYYVEPGTGAWLTLPWPDDLDLLPPSLFPQIVRWSRGLKTPTTPAVDGPRLIHHLYGHPWEFTLGQRKFLHLWYAVRPDERWLYRSGVKRGAKGTGKDPMQAAMSLIAAKGPVELDGFNSDGIPIGRPRRLALVQLASNSEAQSTDVLRVANGMISEVLASENGADPGILRTYLGDSRIEVVTASVATAEGDPASDIFLNESHHMTHSSGGQGLAGVARRNVAKSPGGRARLCEFTNAHLPGEASVAEDSYQAWQDQVGGKTRRADILYDSREAAAQLRLHVEEELELGIAQAYADSPWNDQERLRDEAQDTRVPVADSVRFYLNSLPTNETAWVDPRRFDALSRSGGDATVARGTALTLFLDCSKSTDATTLVGCRVSDGHVLALGGWQRPHGDRGTGWLAPREEVDAAVRAAFDLYDVQWFGVDPSPAKDDETEALYWAPQIDDWHRDYRDQVLLWATPGVGGNSVLFDMRLSSRGGADRNRAFTEMAELTSTEIDEWEPDGKSPAPLTHDGNPMLRQHVQNARRRPNQWGVSLGKQSRDSSRLVDYAVSMVGARLGRRLVLNSGKSKKPRRTGIVY